MVAKIIVVAWDVIDICQIVRIQMQIAMYVLLVNVEIRIMWVDTVSIVWLHVARNSTGDWRRWFRTATREWYHNYVRDGKKRERCNKVLFRMGSGILSHWTWRDWRSAHNSRILYSTDDIWCETNWVYLIWYHSSWKISTVSGVREEVVGSYVR